MIKLNLFRFGRQSGTLVIPANFEIQAASALDARYLVDTKADLIDSTSWVTGGIAYIYEGMQVYVKSEDTIYVLVNEDYTQYSSWQEMASGNFNNVLIYRGDVQDRAHLPVSGMATGDTYYITDEDVTVYYDGTDWTDYSSDKSSFVWKSSVLLTTLETPVYLQLANITRVDDSTIVATADDMKIGKTIIYSVNGTIGTVVGYNDSLGVLVKPIVEDTKSDGVYHTTETLNRTINANTTLDVADVTNLDVTKMVLNETLVFDPDGTLGVVTAYDDVNLEVTVKTITEVFEQNIIEGYFNEADDLFYEEDTYTTPITGETNRIYISLDTNNTYRYDSTNLIFVRLDFETGQIIQVETMPTASVDELNRIVQYVGTTTLVEPIYKNGHFYKCIEDPDTAGTYIWTEISTETGSGQLTKEINAVIEVGGIDSGTVYPIGTEIEKILSDLLEPTLYPTLTNPSASLTYTMNTYYEVGTNISAATATCTLNRGSITPAYGTSGYRSGVATNYAIATTGADTEYSDSSTSTNTFSVPALTRATKGTIKIETTIDYAAGEQPKDSKGGDYSSPLAAGNVKASKTATFIQPYYYGISNTSTISDFTGLTKSVTAKGNKTFNFTTANQFMVFAYDSSYGELKSIIDPNGFETISGWNKSTLTVGGFSYYVYIPALATTDTSAPFTFKY